MAGLGREHEQREKGVEDEVRGWRVQEVFCVWWGGVMWVLRACTAVGAADVAPAATHHPALHSFFVLLSCR